MMETTLDQFLRMYVAMSSARERNERGDVPGWVMVTVMTVGLAIVIFAFAEQPLKDLLTRAFESVK